MEVLENIPSEYQTAGLFAAVLLLVNLVKWLIERYVPSKQKLNVDIDPAIMDNIKQNNALLKNHSQILKEMQIQSDKLYDWHAPDMPDNPGVKIWYTPLAQIKTNERIADTLEKMSEVLSATHRNQEEQLRLQQTNAQEIRSILEYVR